MTFDLPEAGGSLLLLGGYGLELNPFSQPPEMFRLETRFQQWANRPQWIVSIFPHAAPSFLARLASILRLIRSPAR